ncbi:hypothetical protein GCM10023321_59720 [Pseudonocardia eucalypti]|uniref:Uncharacterized protein n=1 Tax=Pseudonocardia eucalypti TaxID=648755 RepID=A0ABP9QTE7_9PSEU|nr:hypothetical protein [Pseudonocardia eucalypti]
MLHIKGHILHVLARGDALWDDELCDLVCTEYGLTGEYWRGTVRLTLTDLYSGGLLDEVDTGIAEDGDRLRVRFRVNDFGRERMRQSGLLTEGAQQ